MIAGFLSGALAALSFPPADVGTIAFVALVPLAWVFVLGKPKQVVAASTAFGITFFGFLLSWIHLFGLAAYVSLIGLQTVIVTAVLATGAWGLKRARESTKAFAFPFAFLAAEFARAHWPLGGFAWGGLAYSQHGSTLLLKLTSIGGAWGLSLLVAAVNVMVLAVLNGLRRPEVGRARSWVWPSLAILAIPVLAWLIPVTEPDAGSAKIAVIQGNAPEGTLDPHYDDREVIASHAVLTENVAGRDPSLVIWPENALDRDPFVDVEFRNVLHDSITSTRAPFLVGALHDLPSVSGVPKLENTSLFFRSDGSLAGRYVKQHLVPFGEYVPARSLLEPLVRQLEQVPYDFVPGPGPEVFSLPEGTFGSVICFESTFPELVNGLVRNGARMLVVSTNNSSFARTSASRQHLAFSQVRAAEQRMWVVHAALTGISAIVSPDGRVHHQTELFTPATIVSSVRFATKTTLYSRLGDWVAIASVVVLLVLIISSLLRKPRITTSPIGREPVTKALVVIPTFNEAENISSMIQRLLLIRPEVHILVVDDGSPDGTARLVRGLESDGRVSLLERPEKAGLGRAYIAGFGWGLEQDYELFLEIDADFSHDPDDVPRLIEAAEDADLVIGSRYVKGGGVVGWSKWRHALSKAGNSYARMMLGCPVHDATSGFRCFRRRVLESVDLTSVGSNGYAFQIEMAYRTHMAGFRIVEIPITFKEREVGTSKMSQAIVREAIWSVTKWALRDRFGSRRRIGRAT